jgi:hypothetical protein
VAQKTLDLEFSGLWTSANPFSKAPGGALETADNVVLRNPSLIEPRRGYEASAANPSGNVSRVAPWGGRVFSFAENGDLRDYSIGTGWSSAYGTYTQPDASSPFRTASAAKTLFFTTASGVKALDKVGGTVLDAGIGPSPFLYGSPDSNGGTWLYAGGSAAYCIVLCRYDASNQLIQSAPSPSAIVSDTPDWPVPAGSAAKATGSSTVTVTAGGVHPFTVGQLITVWFDGAETNFASGTFLVASVPDASHFTYDDHQTQSTGSTVHNVTGANFGTLHGVTVTAYLPEPGYTGATFAQLYRSFSTPRGVTPTSEFFLVSEHKLSAAEIALGSFSFASDVTTDTFLSSPLYTNANSGDGLAASNDLPPLARDLCPVENRLLYVNTTDKHTVELQLIGTDPLHVGSTIVIAGDTYVAGETELFADKQFHLFTSGTAAQNIENTARSLAGVVMNYNLIATTPKVLALYTSGPVDPPGKILIQEVGIGGSAFTVNAGTAGQTCWVPDLSVTTNIVTSDNNRQPARVSYSNDGEPWGVPADNWSQVGAADKAALRAILVRSTVFIFKEDGLFTWQFGSDGAPVVTPFDPGLVLLAPDSCAVVGNQIFCLTNRGAVYVSESGVSPAVSKPIERDISYIQANYDQYPSATYGIGYEEEGLYLLALPVSSSDTGCSQQYVFNTNSPRGRAGSSRAPCTGATTPKSRCSSSR